MEFYARKKTSYERNVSSLWGWNADNVFIDISVKF
jgi:hypothetical protein